ncbi:hypothetical protein LWI29_014452 [Acer saccharum]|uniref:Uncharacterized protein n=1 Tax=Acer saccharum TaxID=4024 RepID=A0AA39RDQ4_ACESA|nr:hypothetical protein LWI29_014452 [Acer saccharum]
MDFDEHLYWAFGAAKFNGPMNPSVQWVIQIKWNILVRFSFDSSHKLQKSSISTPNPSSSVQVQGGFDIIE